MASTSKTKKTKGGLARFIEILWAMVDDENEIKKCGKHISWNESGTGIIIKSRNDLATHVLPTYFNTHDFASFHRQLTNYGFKKLQDVERDEFVNENFRRGFPELRKKIIKKKPPNKHQAGCSSDRSCVMQKGSRVYTFRESSGQSSFSTLLPRNPQDPTPLERLTAKRLQKQMTSLENVPSNQKLKKLKASEVRLTDPATRSPLRSLVTASSVERFPYQANYSPQKEGPLQELLIRNSEEIGHPNSGTQEARNDTVSFAPHTVFEFMEEPVDNMTIGYSTPQMNYLSNMSNATSTVQLNQSFYPGNTGMAGDSLWVPSQQPLGASSQCPGFDDYLPKNDALDSEIDLTEIIPLFHDSMDGPTSDLTALSSQSSFDSSLTSQAFVNVGLHNQNPTENTIQIHEPPEAMQTQVSHGRRGDSSDSGLGSHSSGSISHSRDTSDIENSTLEEIKMRPDAVGLSGAPSCVFLGLSERCPEVQSGYATVENLEQKIQWVKGNKDGRGDCIPPSPEAGRKLVQIYSDSGEKLAKAEVLYVDPCRHKDEDCFERVIDIASRSPADLCRFMRNLYFHIRDQATVKSGETQYSGNFGSSQNVQVLWLLFYKAAESGFQWDSLPLPKFDAMNHDHESAALYLEEITKRFTNDIAASEGPESIDWFEVLSAIIAPLEQDEANDASEDERLHPEDCKDSDSGYYGESLSCDLAEPKSDSEDDLSEVFSKGPSTLRESLKTHPVPNSFCMSLSHNPQGSDLNNTSSDVNATSSGICSDDGDLISSDKSNSGNLSQNQLIRTETKQDFEPKIDPDQVPFYKLVLTMPEDTTPIYRAYILNDSDEAFGVDVNGKSGRSINSIHHDYTTERAPSMISIVSFRDKVLADNDDQDCGEGNSVTNEDAIINLSLSSERLTGLRAYIRGTFQWFPNTASVTEKAICTAMQVLIVGILVCCYGFDIGAFNNRSLVTKERNEIVFAAKNFIWSLRFLELNVLGMLYFRKRHLERMLSKVILTRRHWKKTQKTISKAILAVIFCVIFLPFLLKAAQMDLSTQKVASFNMETTNLANSRSLFARLSALPMFVGFIYEVYIIFSHIRFFKEQIQKWPEGKFEKARNRFIDIKVMIGDAERYFQPFLITHLLLLLILLIPSIFSCAERFQTESYYQRKYSVPMMLTPAAQIPSNTGFIVTNISSFYNNNEMGLFLKITGPNNTHHQVKSYKLPFEHTEKLTDVKEVLRIGCSALGDFLEMLVLYTLPLVFLAKLHKIMTSLPEVVRNLKFSEQREAGYLFQNEEILDKMVATLSTGRGIQIMGINLTGVKTALVTLLLPFLTTAIHLLLLHVDLN